MPRDQFFAQPDFIPPFDRIEQFAGLRIGLTGHRGVLGRILMARFMEHDVQVEPYPGDVTDPQALVTWFAGRSFDIFFHFAARVPVTEVERDLAMAFEVNAIGAYRLCEQLVRTSRVCWLFLPSSSHVYQPAPTSAPRPLRVGDAENPSSTYGRTKLAAEHLCRHFLEVCHQPFCIGRIFSFSHGFQKEPYLVPRLVRRINELTRSQRLTIENPDAVRDIVDAETVIDSILYLAERRFSGTMNIGSGSGMTVAEIARHVAHRLGRSIELEGRDTGDATALVADIEPLRHVIGT